MLIRYLLDRVDTGFNYRSAVLFDFGASSSQKFSGRNSVVAQKPMNAMGVFVAGAVVVEDHYPVPVAGQKKRR